MNTQAIANAIQRVERAVARQPSLSIYQDIPASVALVEGLRVVVRAPMGSDIHTDLGTIMGGGEKDPPPGWLMRSALASCLATSIALQAARKGISLDSLEIQATSQSDVMGLLGDTEEASAAPFSWCLHVKLQSQEMEPDALEALVLHADARSPVSEALRQATQVCLSVNGRVV